MFPRLQKLWKVAIRVLTNLGAHLRRHWCIAFIIAAAIVGLALISWAAYLRWGLGWTWADGTGFGPYVNTDEKLIRGKTLWDWMELLIIPLVLALGAFWLERSERSNDRKIAKERFESEQKLTDQRIENEQKLANQRREDDIKLAENRRSEDQAKSKDQQQETVLQAYIDKMTELLLDKKLSLIYSTSESQVWVVARTRTLTTLPQLNPVRKGILLKFLFEAKLILSSLPKDEEPIISLRGADLSQADLRGIDLNGVNLSESNLSEAHLDGAHLNGADLTQANLREAILSGAYLQGAYLNGADLSRAKLCGARLSGAILSGATLRKAILSDANLFEAYMTGADLNGADLHGSDLSSANMCETNLSCADLSGATLIKTDLYKAILNLADLRQVKLWDAIVTDEQLATARSLQDALLPNCGKFDPAIHTFWKGPPADNIEQNEEGQ